MAGGQSEPLATYHLVVGLPLAWERSLGLRHGMSGDPGGLIDLGFNRRPTRI